MGANGAGKSTLLKLLAGDIKATTGIISYGDKKLTDFSVKSLATKRAVLSQHYHLAFPISVEEIVMMGRYPYFATQPSQKDIAICKSAMQLMEVNEFVEHDYNTLSGGEAQKVQMSGVLAQIWDEEKAEERVLFLDEPVSHLDVKYQYQLLRVAKDLCQQNVTVIAILHDNNLALSFADRIMFIKKTEVAYNLQEPSTISSDIVSDVFGVASKIIYDEHAKPLVIF